MSRLNLLVKTSYKIAVEKGWHDKDRSLSAITLLMQSEVAEAIEEYRVNRGITEVYLEDDGKLCGIPVELADMVIRVADYCGKVSIDLENYSKGDEVLTEEDGCEGALAHIIYALSQAWNSRKEIQSVAYWIGTSVRFTFELAKCFDIDLWAVIDDKTTFNRTRPYRHGGKKI